MKQYTINLRYIANYEVTVQAEDEDEAIDLAYQRAGMANANDFDFDPQDSWVVEEEEILEQVNGSYCE